MNREETIALFLRGRDAWNAWAEKVLAERKALEADGGWVAELDWRGILEPKSEKARAWMEAAKAVFTEAAFETASWPKLNSSAKPIELEANRVDFDGFVFPGDAVFDRVTFAGAASFKGAVFSGAASFEHATFSGDASFHGARFSGPASFDATAFSADALFESATFGGPASFEDTVFQRAAYFRRIQAERSFSLAGARFLSQVPDFISARCTEPIVFDGVRLEPGIEPGFFLQSVFVRAFFWLTGTLDTTLGAKYRALKQLAAQPDGSLHQQTFFRGERRARRYAEDKPWHLAFWFGVLYELFSDFGHSLSRPILWLIALTLVSSWFYLGQSVPAGVSPGAQLQARIVPLLPGAVRLFFPAPRAGALPKLSCKYGDGDPVADAALLGVRQGSVIGAFDSASGTRIYACLYGFDGKLRAPAVPGAVVLWGIGQTVLSAALLFLLLLALRNQFKVK
jgi:hypothetical protein